MNACPLYNSGAVRIVRPILTPDHMLWRTERGPCVKFRGEMAQSISVVIPARNASATLRRAIDSVLAQTLPADEIIVVDDGSSDATPAVASMHGVRLIQQKEALGAAAARNAGVRAAQGEWIAFLDADDEWLPEKLGKQAARIELGQSMIFCASEEFGPDGSSLGDTFRGRPVCSTADAWKALLKTNFVATPTVMAPRALLLQLGGFNERLPLGEDQDMWIRLALAGRVAYVPERLVRVHVQPKSLSAFRPGDQSRYMLPMIEAHLQAQRSKLTKAEAREIRGERLNNAGRIAFVHGDFARGAAFLLRAVLIGYRPLSGLAEIAKAPVAALVRWVLHAMPRRQIAS
jgi:glycosyltransferase involved in cell wall biosynthesis